MDDGYKEVLRLEKLLRNTNMSTTLADYTKSALDGSIDRSVPYDNFVGTKVQLEKEYDRRIALAKQIFERDATQFHVENVEPIYNELMSHFDDLYPEILLPAKDRLYSMAYDRGHSAGYSEVYGILIGLIDDVEYIVRQCCKGNQNEV